MDDTRSMRVFHNDIKLKLLSKYSKLSNDTQLLDIGVGRGGDMHKWNKCNIQSVVGVDINRSFVIDAINRFRSCRYLWGKNYKFFYTLPNKMFKKFLSEKNVHTSFDIISCMFAFHYFWSSEEYLRSILSQISESLKPGGYFIGTCPSGEHITNLMNDNKEFQNTALYIKRHCKTKMHKPGIKIDFLLTGTLYFGESALSTEYLVFKETFEKIAKEYKLDLVEYTPFEKYYPDVTNTFSYPSQVASFLNVAFAFQKK